MDEFETVCGVTIATTTGRRSRRFRGGNEVADRAAPRERHRERVTAAHAHGLR